MADPRFTVPGSEAGTKSADIFIILESSHGSLQTKRVGKSGGQVKMYEGGCLYFVGHRDLLTKSSAIWISPSEVEETVIFNKSLQLTEIAGFPA